MPLKKKVRKYQPKQINYKKYKGKNSSKLELIRPVTMKPLSVMKRLIYFNKAEVINTLLEGGGYSTQFTKFYLNSPWLLGQNGSLYAKDVNGSAWNWNTTVSYHESGHANGDGTTFPGLFGATGSGIARTGDVYRNAFVVGTKVTLRFTPLCSTNNAVTAPTAAFALIETDAPSMLPTTTIDELYAKPYATVRKLRVGNDRIGEVNGAQQSTEIVIKYSSKRFNNLTNIKDNSQMAAHLSPVASANPSQGGGARHPPERDTLTFGIIPILTNMSPKTPMVKHYVEVKVESTVLFTEPTTDNNIYPAEPAGAGSTYVTRSGVVKPFVEVFSN